MEFDMNVWKVGALLSIGTELRTKTLVIPQRAIEVFDIREPMIPQRPRSEMRIGQKWYG